MKLIKLTAISAAVLASTAALAAEPVIVVDNNDAVVYEAEPVAVVQPANSYSDRTFFQTVTHPAAISAEVGTLGYGANIGQGLNETTELQAGWAGGDVADLFGGDFDANGVNYEVDSDFSNPYLGVQLRPAANWFTMGAGIIVPDNDIDVTANPNGSVSGYYEVEDIKYSADGVTLAGTVEHRNKLAPYLTVGFRPNITNNFGVFGEIGAAYTGGQKVTEAKYNSNDINSTLNNSTLKEDLQQDIDDEDLADWMPIAKLGLTYRF